MRIGIDLMGSDSSPNDLFAGVLQASQQLDGVTLVVFATQPVVNSLLPISTGGRVEFQVAPEVIEAIDEPLLAIRQKKNSSLVMGMRLLKKRYLSAFVSAGNTGALIAVATLSFPLLPGVKRPALLATLPTEKGYVAVIDVGGNVSCKAHHLVQFAQIGAAFQSCSQGISIPKVGLLNIGVESKKGTSELQKAYQILQDQQRISSQKLDFIGNIEGREVFQGKVDVLVTDGFTGNVLLKTSEGVSHFILKHLRHAVDGIPSEQKEHIVRQLKYQFDYEEYSGAIICGIEGVAVKCHGKSSAKGMLNGIIGAAELVNNGFINQIKQHLIS